MVDTKKEQERDELHRAIWAIADELRGAVDGWDFKNYVLGTMFYRYISENLCNYINSGEADAGNIGFDFAKISDEDAEEAREGLVEEKGFFILPSELFCNVRADAANDENLNETLERVFRHIEESAQGSEFIIDLLKGNSHFSPEDIAHTRLTTDDSRDINKPLDLTEMPVEEVLPVVPDTDSGKPVLLIVEDNKEMLDLLKSIFESMYEVHIAQNGKEGLQMAYQVHPSLIISDVMMPEMSGKELCYKIKNSIELSYIPVILLTAQVSEQYTIEGYMFGADDYITKPFNVKILIARCSNLIKTRQQMLERLKQPIANKQEAPDTININDRQLLEKATQIIKENFENPEFDMNLLASELGMGRSKLYTKLKEITGLTPNEFTLKLKLEEAMHLLNNAPHLNVTEISYQLGFSSARYFSKCFKTFYGIAPLNVRKNANPPAKEE